MRPIHGDKITFVPDDEYHEDYGIFFGEKSKKVGLEIDIELELNPHKILKVLELVKIKICMITTILFCNISYFSVK